MTTWRNELEAHGWVRISGIKTDASLLEVAGQLGTVIAGDGPIKRLRPLRQQEARKGTLSARHGAGPFPLHTDTAFWPRPARYLVMRVVGDCRRPTTLVPFSLLFASDAQLQRLAAQSTWRIRTPAGQHYVSMEFRSDGEVGWRFDAQCMFPMNRAAREVAKTFGRTPRVETHALAWTEDSALIVANWKTLHGRGDAPPEERLRELHRIYVE